MNYIEQLGEKALEAKRKIATASTGEKNKVLEAIAQVLLENSDAILAENEKDIANARDNGISETMVDRLRLTKERIKGIADACMELVNLEDPVGEVLQGSVRPNGMRITKVRVPMGVIGIIYESRPNVTVDAGALCLKSGNAAILRGGKEAIHSNMILVNLMQRALETSGFAKETIQLVDVSNFLPFSPNLNAILSKLLQKLQNIGIIIKYVFTHYVSSNIYLSILLIVGYSNNLPISIKHPIFSVIWLVICIACIEFPPISKKLSFISIFSIFKTSLQIASNCS